MKRENGQKAYKQGAASFSVSIPNHELVGQVVLKKRLFGSVCQLNLLDGSIRVRTLLFFKPKPGREFHYNDGRFLIERRPVRGEHIFRLFWHDFEKGKDLTIIKRTGPI